MATNETIEKLRTLGVFPDTPENPNSVRENAEIFEKCTTLSAIGEEAGRRHWGCGSGQFLYFHLEALLKKEPEYKSRFLEEAKKQLGSLGISAHHIDEYFESSSDPGLAFTFRHEEDYNADIRSTFYEKADQFALDKMRQWLNYK